MQFSITLLSLLPAALVSAVPLESRTLPEVTFSLSNDQSGANAGATFPVNGYDRSISDIFKGTSVAASGNVLASSAQLTAFPQNINCVLKNNGNYIATLTAQNTYVDIDGNPAVSTPINLNGATINCHV
ncbi:hypothetical protein N7493_001070 [Penicillium malachiteum]|uniref:Uncharacterized protein n=1 Tax=Penicillium malachiteum TaxID=1324776 RepID=A0AAD6HYA4_9EURO|nr:hypothetical protein N7493_001070 [Penicillium malachiteum]